ncbi:DUF3467 domain-containing protein [Candidatus Woesearchaeota archaeon]|nr:DUF3467 domain-containing protein [Candidatus Woesearchaeota archaeon]
MEQKQVQAIQNIDNSPLMSNQQTVAHQPDKFIIDFKGVYPQYTPDNKQAIVVNHRVILLDPYVAKDFLDILKSNIERYEKKYGKIAKPANIKKAEKAIKKLQKQAATGTEAPSYMG